jgi:membrane protease YdiL (CAAX protease family)
MSPSPDWLQIAGWYHLVFFGLLGPALAVRTARRLLGTTRPLPDRLKHFKSTSLTLFLFMSLSLVVARAQYIDLFPRALPALQGVLAGIATYVIAVACMRPRWRHAVERRVRVVHLFMPDNAAERAWWVFVSVLAGVGEEITWRGVQTTLLFWLTGSYVLAAVASALSFGVGHIMQGWKSAAIIGILALVLQGVVWLSGSLYVAMAVHAAYDVTAGMTYGRLGRELGYGQRQESPEGPA